MKKFLIGLVSVVLVIASIFGAPRQGTRGRRVSGSSDSPDRAMWV